MFSPAKISCSVNYWLTSLPCAGWSLRSGYILSRLTCSCVCCSTRACSGTSSFHLWPVLVIMVAQVNLSVLNNDVCNNPNAGVPIACLLWKVRSVFGNWVLKTAVWRACWSGVWLWAQGLNGLILALFCLALDTLAQIKVLQQLWSVPVALMQYCQLLGIKNHYSGQKNAVSVRLFILFI